MGDLMSPGTIKCIYLHLMFPILLPYFNQICISSSDFHKDPSIKCHGNPSTGSRADMH